jgi:hypothetical protein
MPVTRNAFREGLESNTLSTDIHQPSQVTMDVDMQPSEGSEPMEIDLQTSQASQTSGSSQGSRLSWQDRRRHTQSITAVRRYIKVSGFFGIDDFLSAYSQSKDRDVGQTRNLFIKNGHAERALAIL